jgi:predicted Zn-dependent protease
MVALSELARAAEAAFTLARAEPGVREVEVFAASNAHLLARLAYTSHIPCNGVEEPKSTSAHGLGLQIVLEHPEGPHIGFGSEAGDLGPAGARRALARARAAAVADPHFVSLPRPTGESRTLDGYHDPELMRIADERLVEAGWTVVQGALRAFLTSPDLAAIAGSEEALASLGLILGGDVSIVQERMAVVSTGLPEVQTDESTLLTASTTAMVEARRAKGSGCALATRLGDLTDEAGVEAALSAVAAMDGVRVPTGDYTVILGPQPVADLVNNLLVPACRADAFYAGTTPFLGRVGRAVASPLLAVYDHGALRGRLASRGITCEGLPTGRTDLIKDGVLVGLLSNWYQTRRLLADRDGPGRLGAAGPAAARALVPRNGFRLGSGPGRCFDARPDVAATNVILETRETESLETLLRRVERGLYIGRIWYTYPINGLRAGDFTCTVVADSYVIRDGRRGAPIRPNTLRVNDNIATILNNLVGGTADARGTVVWAADEAVYAPAIAVSGVHVDAIAGVPEDPSDR